VWGVSVSSGADRLFLAPPTLRRGEETSESGVRPTTLPGVTRAFVGRLLEDMLGGEQEEDRVQALVEGEVG
jgi:hypothetical protein